MREEIRHQMLERMESVIRQYGFMVQAVFPTVNDPEGPHFQYTVGLHDSGLPELVSFGLPGEVGHALLSDAVDLLKQRKQDGLPLVGEFTHERWPLPFYVVQADAHVAEDYATAAYNRSRGQATYLQVCWPDKEGRFPWQPGVAASIREAQPLLSRPHLLN